MVCPIAVVFSALVVGAFAALDDSLKNQLQPLQTIESRFSETFPNHISNAILSSLVYVKNRTHHLCDGVIVYSRQAIFTDTCLGNNVLEDEKNGFSEYSVVVQTAITHNVKNYSIKSIHYEIGSKLYDFHCDTEPFAAIILTEAVRGVKSITRPSTEVEDDSAGVVGGWDKNGKFKMYYVPDLEVNVDIYTPRAADGFRGGYVFQKHMLIGLFYEISEELSSTDLDIQENSSSYLQVCCDVRIHKNPILYVKQLCKKVLFEMSERTSDDEPAFFTEGTSYHSDTNSD